jgi:hypothetical protein
VSDDLRSQLQTMARWADAQHEPIDPGVALGSPPIDGEAPALLLDLPSSVPPSAPPADRRRWLVLAAALLVVVVGTSALVARRDGVTVDIPPAAPSPNGWSAGAGFPAGTGGTGSLNGNIGLTWTGTEVLAANADPASDPMPTIVLMGEDGPVGTVPGWEDGRHGRFGRSLAYDPLRRTWRTLPDPGLDITRDEVPWVWTGTEYIVAGRPQMAGCVGQAGDTPPTTLACSPGGAYASALDPASGTWRRLADPPEYEIESTEGLWTGDTAVFVGGSITTYAPATDTWRVLTRGMSAPLEQERPTFNSWAWDGRELILVFSFRHGSGDLESRAWGMDLATGTIRDLPGPPIAVEHLVETGDGVIGWAVDGSVSRWDPATATWTLGATAPIEPRAIGARNGTIAWTGDRLVVWGGGSPDPGPGLPDLSDVSFTDGAIYDPTTDTWTPIPPIDLPGVDTRNPSAAVWVGVGLVVVQMSGEGYEILTWSPL